MCDLPSLPVLSSPSLYSSSPSLYIPPLVSSPSLYSPLSFLPLLYPLPSLYSAVPDPLLSVSQVREATVLIPVRSGPGSVQTNICLLFASVTSGPWAWDVWLLTDHLSMLLGMFYFCKRRCL